MPDLTAAATGRELRELLDSLEQHAILPRALPRQGGKTATVDFFRLARQAAELLDPPAPAPTQTRHFGPAHARIVFLLSQTSGATFTRLERLWAAKAARAGDLAWPFISSSGLRTRVSELKRWGVVEWSGDWGSTVSNRRSRVWRLADLTAGAATQIPGYEPETRDALAALRAEAGSDLYTIAHLESVTAAAGAR